MILEIRIQKLEIWMNSFCIFVKKNFMGIPELKEIIKLKLENADERVLRIVDSVLNEYSKETIAFDSKGYALNLDEYQLKVEEGFEDIKNNKTFSNDEMASKIQQLKRK
ncbi:hypothetical protein [Flavobacterium sp. UBA6195]|uniref:hypothetical protein n=1 Tax=Flavobacterium sp. UBA6195 TaxID=1946554 RepID=UPI0011D4C466|nr:hypothetical protein [Flavobacterium sp. UBA6195]TXI69177.1 MAG: hypothetical protein E6Q45_04360 [Flavobacterium sp.]